MAFLFVQHLEPHRKSHLPEILGNRADGVPIKILATDVNEVALEKARRQGSESSSPCRGTRHEHSFAHRHCRR
jgi:hypothetical protein